jgi:hypothetical protein
MRRIPMKGRGERRRRESRWMREKGRRCRE